MTLLHTLPRPATARPVLIGAVLAMTCGVLVGLVLELPAEMSAPRAPSPQLIKALDPNYLSYLRMLSTLGPAPLRTRYVAQPTAARHDTAGDRAFDEPADRAWGEAEPEWADQDADAEREAPAGPWRRERADRWDDRYVQPVPSWTWPAPRQAYAPRDPPARWAPRYDAPTARTDDEPQPPPPPRPSGR